MNNMIYFDRVEEARDILKSGIASTSNSARRDLKTAAWYLINKTTYTKTQIEERLKKVSGDYFKGMPEKYVSDCISEIVTSAKEMRVNENVSDFNNEITIYKSELDRISKIHHDDTERLAFVFLCMAKMVPYAQVYECNSKVYQLAWRYYYDNATKTVMQKANKRRVGGSEPTNRVNSLCQLGLLKYFARINGTYSKAQSKSTASTTFAVPFLQNDGEVAFKITSPDADSLVLYYDRYKGYKGIITCEKCGRPVFKTGRRQKYCSRCAEVMNHSPEKRDL